MVTGQIARAMEKARLILRPATEEAFLDTFTLKRPPTEPVSNGRGGFTSTPDVVLSDIKGRFEAAAGSEQPVSGVVIGVRDFIIELVSFQDVRPEDVLECPERESEPAHSFRVKAKLSKSDEVITKVLATEG